MKVKVSLNVTFDEIPPPTKLSPLVDDDVGKEEAIRKIPKTGILIYKGDVAVFMRMNPLRIEELSNLGSKFGHVSE
ncbi:hypothetical protein Tco_0408601 [Tanacetum coccineum]